MSRITLVVAIGFALACAGVGAPDAGRAESRRALVEGVYANGCRVPELEALPLSPQLAALVAADREYSMRTQSVGNLDFQPLVNGQDCDALVLLDVRQEGDTLVTRVRNFQEFELTWVFDGDEISDLKTSDWSLVAILSRTPG